MTVYHDERDYEDFVALMAKACKRVQMRVLGYCLMPNHLHLALWPQEDDDMGQWMQWLMTSQVRRHHVRHDTSGHVWQGRYKSFPVQNDAHLATVLRYIERNPVRAGLVSQAADWPWSSHRWWSVPGGQGFLHPTATVRLPDWPDVVNQPQTQAELAALRTCVKHGRPYGGADWVHQIAARLGLEATLRRVGRPKNGDCPHFPIGLPGQ